MNGAGRSFDAIPSPYKFEDMAFSKLKSVHFKQLNQSFDCIYREKGSAISQKWNYAFI